MFIIDVVISCIILWLILLGLGALLVFACLIVFAMSGFVMLLGCDL